MAVGRRPLAREECATLGNDFVQTALKILLGKWIKADPGAESLAECDRALRSGLRGSGTGDHILKSRPDVLQRVLTQVAEAGCTSTSGISPSWPILRFGSTPTSFAQAS